MVANNAFILKELKEEGEKRMLLKILNKKFLKYKLRLKLVVSKILETTIFLFRKIVSIKGIRSTLLLVVYGEKI